MISVMSPNRVIVFGIAAFVAYWLAALFIPQQTLLNIINPLSFGAAAGIVVTWLPAAIRAIKEESRGGEWLLILAIFFTWLVVAMQRIYAIAFNWYESPQSWVDGPMPAFFSYSYLIAGLAFLTAPEVNSEGMRARGFWTLLIAVAIGGFVAGALFVVNVSAVV